MIVRKIEEKLKENTKEKELAFLIKTNHGPLWVHLWRGLFPIKWEVVAFLEHEPIYRKHFIRYSSALNHFKEVINELIRYYTDQ